MKTTTKHAANEPIAIVGSACRFPGGANTPSKLWDLLREPKDVQTEIPTSRFNPDGFYHPDGTHHGTSNVRHSYLLSEDCRQFDAQFFGIKPVEANAIDPQQRLLLETTYESIEAAGIRVEKLRGSDTAVYIGLMCGDYADLMLRDPEAFPTYIATGTARSIMSNRVSYFFDWHGPCMTIDTACSSSLVAVHHAVQTLRSGNSRIAIAGGSNLCLGPEPYIGESNLAMLSPTGRSRMWDAAADGYARGDGVAAVVLKTLSSALKDGDHIECIIRETGVNQDGRTPGITMPSAAAQRALVRDTYARAGLDLSRREDRCQYFEAHGTGTPTGDPLEAEAISSAFFPPGHKLDTLYVGSIKTVVGHTEGTAGLAGLLKASLALQAGMVPPNLHFENLAPKVKPFYQNLKIVVGKAKPWPATVKGAPRRASVNSFGFGGTNAHAILESYEPTVESRLGADVPNVLPLSFTATSERSLINTLASYEDYLKENPNTDIRSLAWTLNFRRSHFPLQTTLAAVSVDALQSVIRQKLEDIKNVRPDSFVSNKKQAKAARKPILGVFTGQGAQWSMMMSELARNSAFVQRRLRALESRLAKLPKDDRPAWSLLQELMSGSSRIKEAALSQPLCTAVQIILVDILRAADIKLDAVVGHSSGEIGAAYAAGLLSAEDAICIAYYRGLCSRLACGESGAEGGMLAVSTSYEDAVDLCATPELEGRVAIAACNSSTSFTLSGDRQAVELTKDILADEGKFARVLQVDKAYHSYHMRKCADAYVAAMKKCQIKVQSPGDTKSPVWYSSVSDAIMTAERSDLADIYWNDNMVNPVLFSQAVERAVSGSGPFAMAIEIGPHAALKGPATQIVSELIETAMPYTGLLDRKKNDLEAVADCVGAMINHLGTNSVNLQKLDQALTEAPKPLPLKSLPPYGWNHDRSYWQESRSSRAYRTREPIHPLLGARVPDGADQEFRWRNFLSPKELPWLTGHMIQGQIVFPAAGYISTCVEAAKAISRDNEVRLVELVDLTLGQALVFEDETSKVETLFSITSIQHINHDRLEASFVFYSAVGKESNTLNANASGKLTVVYGDAAADVLPKRGPAQLELIDVPEDRFYTVLKDIGYGYSGPFRALKKLKRKLMKTVGIAQTSHELMDHITLAINPAMLDATIQSIMLAKSWPGDGRLGSLHVPKRIGRVSVNLSVCEATQSDPYFETSVYDNELSGITGDIKIFPDSSQYAMIQMEGVLAVPLDAATAGNDRIFSQMVWDYAAPNGEAVAFDGRASQSDYDLAYILERVAHFYLRHFDRVIDPHHESRRHGSYVGLLNYAKHVAASVETGENVYADREWVNDTAAVINRESQRFPDNIDLKVMHVIGKHMPAVIRGEANILEYLKEDRLLDRYYEQAMGIGYYTHYLARLVETVVHRYPHMSILELGAGTGGATKHIMKAIQGTFKSYTFTDISSGFFENAKDLFQDYEGKMAFKVLDLEKDVSSQGFVEQSYDLVIASFVLHATSKLRATMENARRLLKPGGYLLMLEVTNLEQSRLGFIFGSLPGWWLGADDGRVLSPCLPKEQWDRLLRETGFSGIDTATPDPDALPFPASAIVTQAVDASIEFLRDPLAAPYEVIKIGPAIQDLVLLGGKSSTVADLVKDLRDILPSHAESVTHYAMLEQLNSENLPQGATTVVLADLDEPIFKSLTEKGLEGLKALYERSRAVLWVTQGGRADNPHHNQSLGFGRSMLVEMAHVRSQFLDLDSSLTPSTPKAIAEHLLRFAIFDESEAQHLQERIVWSTEPELALEDSFLRIPRIKPNQEQNDRYNSARLVMTEQVDLKHVPVEITAGETSYTLQRASIPDSMPIHFVTIKVQNSMSNPVSMGHNSALFLVSGILANTGFTAIAVSEHNASVVKVPKNWVTLYPEAVSAALFRQVYHHTISSDVMGNLKKGDLVVVLDAELDMLLSLQTQAASRGIRLSVLFSADKYNIVPPGLQSTSVNKYCMKNEILANLPLGISVFFNASLELDLAGRIVECLPQSCRVQHVAAMMHVKSQVDVSTWTASVSGRLRGFLDAARTDVGSIGRLMPGLPSSISFTATQGQGVQNGAARVIDWASDSVCDVNIQTIHAQTQLSRDKTYWLVGLTGSLGISLCRWMIKHGARTIVFTSRNPQIDQQILDELSTSGATIKVLAADVTSKQSLTELYNRLASTLPPIAGVVQGAMVLRDAMLIDMTIEQFNSVLAPKVEGSKNLDELFSNDTLDFFVMFSSATCVTGNIGQSNYSVANMFMTGLAAQRRKRGLAGSVINIGAILGVGYVTRETSQELQNNLLKSGHVWMSEEDFHTLFAEAVLAGSPALGLNPEINSGLRTINESDKQRPLWSFSPKFQHLVKQEEVVVAEDSRAGARVPIRLLLAAASSADLAMELLRETFIAKLNVMLQLDDSMKQGTISDMRAEDLGIDSLNAVEIRSWILKELKVDVPVLRILGGSTIHDLLNYILENIPADLVPLLGAERQVLNSVTQPLVPGQLPVVAPANSPGVAPESSEDDVEDDYFLISNYADVDEESVLSFDAQEKVASFPSFILDAGSNSPSATDDDGPQTSSTTESFTAITMPEDSESGPDAKIISGIDSEPSSGSSAKDVSFQKSLPMSYAQSHFWFLKHYVEDQTTFNITVTMEVSGTLHQKDLERAVVAVGQRHEALRTCFFLDKNQQPMQGILKDSLLRLEKKAYSNDVERQLEIQMIRDHTYDIENGESMRILLLSPMSPRNRQSSYLVIGYHHINMDGISFQLLLNDLRQSYSHKPLVGDVLQYPDHAVRQRRQHEKGNWRDDLEYWHREFKEHPPVLPLLPVASVRQRRALTRYEHHKVEFRVGPDLATGIRSVCKQGKISPYHFYLTAFKVLLARLSGILDLCIGVADGGRIESDTLTSIGLYLNLLPLRVQYKPGQSFIDATKEVRSRAYAAMAHSRPPFDMLLTELNVPRSASHSPLFQAFVDYRQSIEEKQVFGDCVLEGREYEVGRTAYDVALDVSDNARGEALLMFAVQAGVYSPEAAAALLRCYTKLLHQFCENPSGRVGEVSLYWEEDINKAIVAGRGETKISKWEKTLPHQVARMAQLYPNNLAVKDESGKSMTYRTMMRRAGHIAAALTESGIRPGANVGVFQDATTDWICSMLAVMRTGCAYVPLDLKVGIQRLALAVKDCKPSTILFDSTTQAQLQELGASEVLTINVENISGSSVTNAENHAHPDSPALILYTSGSTGTPKGAVLKHSGIRNNIEGNTEEFHIGPADYGLQQISLSFDFSVWQIFMCLANGAGLLMAPKAARGDAKALTELIVAEGITFTGATPSEYISWLRHGSTAALRSSAWTCAVSSGEQMTDVMKRQFGALEKPSLKLFNGYGPTEGSFSAAKIPVEYLDEREASRNFTPGGYTQPNYSIYILDDNEQPVPCGFEGQISIGGAGVGLGYLSNQELTAQKFVPDPFVPDEYRQQGWTTMHLTGDRGVLRPDGALIIQGRISGDTQIKLRGLRMDLRDIEAVIVQAADGSVHDAVVSVRRTGDNTEFLAAHIVFAPQFSPERRGALLETLPRSLPLPQYMVPSVFVPLARLPLNAHLKLDRRAVAELPLPEASKKRVRFLDTELSAIEEKLAVIWQRVISAEIRGDTEITKTSDFFRVGGNSLLLLQLRDEVHRSFGVDLPLIQLFEASSLESMAARVLAIVGPGSGPGPSKPTSENKPSTGVPGGPLADTSTANKATSGPIETIGEPSHAPSKFTTATGDIDWDEVTQILIKPTVFKTPRQPQSELRTVVLTGATGFLGKALLRHLEQDKGVTKIHCIAVRNPQNLEGTFRSSKVSLHQGDLAAPRLGLSESAAETIFAEASVVIHNGADVSFLKPYAALKATNVGSTRELVQMALPYRIPIHFVSTAGVAQFAGRKVVGEESVKSVRPRADSGGIGAGYAASKWASEALLEKASRDLGLPVTVHRPTNVTGNSADGDAEPATDVVDSLLRYSRQVGAVPVSDVWDADGELDFVSVGTVAEQVATAATEESGQRQSGQALRFMHHSGEVRVALHAVKQFLERESGRHLRAVPLAVWVAEAEMAGLNPLVAEVLVEAERRGVKMAFPKLVKGRASQELVSGLKGRGLLRSLSRMASSVGSVFSLV
ncbi:MAG: putative Hybrid PKS-NRPS biosynthetic cluster [Geoglossum umbratile]|nr:MAG: putative Hybrid PKS-NRPS biosynthetic cluster [Geoglossum umbratile]